MCGEELDNANYSNVREEIPPRVRGRELWWVTPPMVEGNTPACAGKRYRSSRRWYSAGKYPRVCGEEQPVRTLLLARWEIPPRVRGRGDMERGNNDEPRNTPACAGKSTPAQYALIMRWKYPRVCGEEKQSPTRFEIEIEIPPRVRGRAPKVLFADSVAGNTPACAGKSCLIRCWWFRRRKYPRVCGEEL
ncbi:Domain of uncharacterised function (DUF2825) [Arcanobacterium haemolyticum]|nr:Domain of uncharacterised function (DUF2825) [Arcanobacterium haemolyticum]